MKIEWDEPRVPKRNADSLWTKVRNSLSVVRQTHDGPPPTSTRERRNSYSPSPSRGSTSRSSSRPPSSSHQRSRSTGRPSPTYAQHVAPSPSGRPIVTIQTNGGPPQVIRGSSGQYGATTYIVQQSPKIYDPYAYASSPRINSPVPSVRPAAVHRSSVPLSSSPLRSPATPRAAPPRRSTAPLSAGTNGGVMYNGKLIVGDPDEVQRYISSQKTIEKWLENVG